MRYIVYVINHAKKKANHKCILPSGNKSQMLKAVFTAKNVQIHRVRYSQDWAGKDVCFVWLIDNDDILLKLQKFCGVNKFFNC